MGKSEQAEVRALRLAAKLRENLKRRKEQAKARAPGAVPATGSPAPGTGTDKEP
jgi:hypothetical protein